MEIQTAQTPITPSPIATTVSARPIKKKPFNYNKIIYLLIGIIFIVIIVVLGLKLFQSSSKNKSATKAQNIGQIQPLTGGEIALISDKIEYRVGQIVPVAVKVSTGGYTSLGTDLVLKYNPDLLEISSSSDIMNGDAYKEYPSKTFDQKSGLVGVSAISALNSSGFNGIGTLVKINFKAKSAGKASLKIDFTPGATNDSNIIRLGDHNNTSEDILAKVDNIDITIK